MLSNELSVAEMLGIQKSMIMNNWTTLTMSWYAISPKITKMRLILIPWEKYWADLSVIRKHQNSRSKEDSSRMMMITTLLIIMMSNSGSITTMEWQTSQLILEMFPWLPSLALIARILYALQMEVIKNCITIVCLPLTLAMVVSCFRGLWRKCNYRYPKIRACFCSIISNDYY